jgi:uncharacterized protein (DUF1697 family)
VANQFVAFLRAINVGGRVVRMTALKAAFEQLGLSDVATFIASGNVVFKSPARDVGKLEKRVARALEDTLGYPVGTFIRTTGEVARIAEYQPFPGKPTDGATLFIGFLPNAPAADARDKVLKLRTSNDDLCIDGRELYWLRRGSLLESPVSGKLLEKLLNMPTTLRNVNTIRRLALKYPPQ